MRRSPRGMRRRSWRSIEYWTGWSERVRVNGANGRTGEPLPPDDHPRLDPRDLAEHGHLATAHLGHTGRHGRKPDRQAAVITRAEDHPIGAQRGGVVNGLVS